MGSSDADTEVWFTAIMHPVIGAIYTRHSGGSTSTIGSQKSNSAVTIKSPHRKNSLTPGSNATMVAAAAVAAAAISEDSKPIETISMTGETYVTNNSKITGKSISQVTAGTTTVSSPNADTALKRSESALIEAAKLAEGWRFSETDDILLVDEDTNAAEEGDESL